MIRRMRRPLDHWPGGFSFWQWKYDRQKDRRLSGYWQLPSNLLWWNKKHCHSPCLFASLFPVPSHATPCAESGVSSVFLRDSRSGSPLESCIWLIWASLRKCLSLNKLPLGCMGMIHKIKNASTFQNTHKKEIDFSRSEIWPRGGMASSEIKGN